MRDIKFRGKRIDNGEWVYGYLVPWNNQSYQSQERMCIRTGIIDTAEVDPETVGQFTGIKNVYEGDIVKQFGGHILKVVFDKGAFWYIGKNGCNWPLETISAVEVIGKIHDNPELLEATSCRK